MNFVTVTTAGGELMMGQSKLSLAGEAAKVAAARPAGSNLTIGFRPEHLEVANGTGEHAMRFPATVDVVEYLGNEELIHARAEGNEIVALLPSERKVKAGEKVRAGGAHRPAVRLRSRNREVAGQLIECEAADQAATSNCHLPVAS